MPSGAGLCSMSAFFPHSSTLKMQPKLTAPLCMTGSGKGKEPEVNCLCCLPNLPSRRIAAGILLPLQYVWCKGECCKALMVKDKMPTQMKMAEWLRALMVAYRMVGTDEERMAGTYKERKEWWAPMRQNDDTRCSVSMCMKTAINMHKNKDSYVPTISITIMYYKKYIKRHTILSQKKTP